MISVASRPDMPGIAMSYGGKAWRGVRDTEEI